MLVSYCIVNTNGREFLLACLAAIQRTTPPQFEYEVLIADNASTDGSVDELTKLGPDVEVIAHTQRRGKAENDSLLMRRARGTYCMLLNEDSEPLDDCVLSLVTALERHPEAGAAAAQLVDPQGSLQPCAWRLPSPATALAAALYMHRLVTVQSPAKTTRRVGWAQSAAMLVRSDAAAAVGYLDPRFFVYSDETDFCKRLCDAGWATLLVPQAQAIHHEQLATDLAAAKRRIVEFHRNRDLYMRKHHGRPSALVVRVLTAWTYLLRALAALAVPGRSPKRYLLHARQALWPYRGEGIRDAAERYNQRLRKDPP